MKAYGGGRREGKTHKLMTEHFLRGDMILLVMSEAEKKRLTRDYHLGQKDADRIMVWDYARDRLQGWRTGILIDNLDTFLWQVFGQRPVAVTYTTE